MNRTIELRLSLENQIIENMKWTSLSFLQWYHVVILKQCGSNKL